MKSSSTEDFSDKVVKNMGSTVSYWTVDDFFQVHFLQPHHPKECIKLGMRAVPQLCDYGRLLSGSVTSWLKFWRSHRVNRAYTLRWGRWIHRVKPRKGTGWSKTFSSQIWTEGHTPYTFLLVMKIPTLQQIHSLALIQNQSPHNMRQKILGPFLQEERYEFFWCAFIKPK